jgi:hypothetical protein
MKTSIARGKEGENIIMFWCPGCDEAHGIRVARSAAEPKQSCWTWNDDQENPTFSPSILAHLDGRESGKKCHSFVKDGQIQFLEDSWHSLKGQTVPLPEWPYNDVD